MSNFNLLVRAGRKATRFARNGPQGPKGAEEGYSLLKNKLDPYCNAVQSIPNTQPA